ncbi:MAG: bifunctional homocysteine S-methyltransferase/methylenetetrahydrofolate reductase [Planctomycetia bacterium]|nr:bifunctional homocysteine S-methyltransferase/methylenetetrahydrofolate reductase [Planctomycetia bacterium]
MSHDPLWRRFSEGILLFDGGIGSEIYKRNFFVNRSFEELSLSAPKEIEAVHRAYLEAGTEVLTTNTFGANENRLRGFGLADEIVEEICTASVALARRSIDAWRMDAKGSKDGDRDVFVAGSIGPVGDRHDPPMDDERFRAILSRREDALRERRKDGITKLPLLDSLTEEERFSAAILARQAIALTEAGVDFLLFESIPSARDLRGAVAAAQWVDTPYILSLTLTREAESVAGHEPLSVLLASIPSGTDFRRKPSAIGLNCGEGPEGMLSSLEKLIEVVHYPIVVRPNAGTPKSIDNRMMYMASPEYFSTWAMRYVTIGARGVGGCCGIGPEHIADMVRTVRPYAASHGRKLTPAVRVEEASEQPAIPMAEKSRLAGRLANREWVTTVEITPPTGFDLTPILAKAERCRDAGVDAINIPDGPRASCRISSMVTALEIQRIAGIEAVLHVCCRDRNLIGIQSDILGCMSVGIRNMLFITGDPPKLGDYPFSSGVFDVDSVGMAKIVHRLNRGIDIGGKAMKRPTAILVGVGADPNSIDPEYEFRHTCEKLDAGAEYITTQPVFEPAQLLRFVERLRGAGYDVPVVAGIWPLASLRNAEFMRNEVPGVVIPDEIMTRMAAADSKESQREEGIRIAREAIDRVRDSVQGIQVSAPLGNVETAIAVLSPKRS